MFELTQIITWHFIRRNELKTWIDQEELKIETREWNGPKSASLRVRTNNIVIQKQRREKVIIKTQICWSWLKSTPSVKWKGIYIISWSLTKYMNQLGMCSVGLRLIEGNLYKYLPYQIPSMKYLYDQVMNSGFGFNFILLLIFLIPSCNLLAWTFHCFIVVLPYSLSMPLISRWTHIEYDTNFIFTMYKRSQL